MLIGKDMKLLLNNTDNLGEFVGIYEKTPLQFIEECEAECSIDLDGKFVVSLEANILPSENDVTILGAYFVKEGQKSVLEYHGHISFIKITKDDNLFELIYKDDECYPQSFNEWWNNSLETHCFENTTKEKCLELIRYFIIGTSQDLDLDIREDNLIILEGL